MGGYGSGRRGGRPTVEGGLVLDLGKLLRQQLFRPGIDYGGSIVWTNTATKQQIAQIGYQAFMGSERGHVRLTYTITNTFTGEKRHSDYSITLETTEQPFGGRRWWFVCPSRGERVAKLYLPPGGSTFASRRAYRLAYRSQRETPHDRALSRAQDGRQKLGGTCNLADLIPEKPKWMRWTTYERKVARIEASERVCNAYLWQFIHKLKQR